MTEQNPQNPNPSLASLQSSTTITSTAPLIPERKPPQKDFEAALASLQSRYGMGGDIPPPKNTPSNKLPDPNNKVPRMPLPTASSSTSPTLGQSPSSSMSSVPYSIDSNSRDTQKGLRATLKRKGLSLLPTLRKKDKGAAKGEENDASGVEEEGVQDKSL
ncbi:hypothetical protein H1R20_g3280, partial [Candolleomyces eurysporus]